MIRFISAAPDGRSFTLQVAGQERTYSADKMGRRQAILDGLEAIETVAVGRDVYLPSNAALQAVAAVLYPEGIQTEETYQLVYQVTEKACAHIGYGAEVELGPPHVPFTARGAYRKRYPPVDPQLVLDELKLAGTSSYHPRREANRRSLWNKVAWEVYGKPLSGLTEGQQTQIQAQVDAIADGAGWQRDDDDADVYTRPLAVNDDGARGRLAQYLQDAGGRPVPVRAIRSQAPTVALSTMMNWRQSWRLLSLNCFRPTATRRSQRRANTGRCRSPSPQMQPNLSGDYP